MISVIVFDLDDTLYPESEYVASGFRAVARSLTDDPDRQVQLVTMMRRLAHTDSGHVFNRLLAELSPARYATTLTSVRELVTKYREHQPSIALYSDVTPVLAQLRSMGVKTALVTDGHAVSQWHKICALGLEKKIGKIIVTDELGPNRMYWKPHLRAFEMTLAHFGSRPADVCYVGDNARKDFVAPNALGMHSVLIRRESGYHSADSLSGIEQASRPEFTIRNLWNLLGLVRRTGSA